MKYLPRCQICGNNVEKTYKCTVCGEKFCEWCGDVNDKICIDCLDSQEQDYESNYEDK